MIEFLLQKGADIHLKNDSNTSALELLERKCAKIPDGVDWASIQQLFNSSRLSYSKTLPMKSGSKAPFLPDEKRKKVLNQAENGPCEPMDYEEFTFIGNETYRASGLKTSIHGTVYQLQLILLFLHRSMTLYDSVYLATELDEAEKFDDIVLKFKKSESDKNWCWRFVQAKHLLLGEKEPIRPGELFSKSCKQVAKFSLHKYVSSFIKIKQNPFFENSTLEEFTICTNTNFDSKAITYFVEDKHFERDKILFFRNYPDMKRYKLQTSANDSIRRVYESVEKTKINEKHLEDFLKKFRFIVNYPNRVRLNHLIRNEMTNYFGLLDADLATSAFKNYILDWFMRYKDRRSEYLLIKDGKEFLKDTKRQIKQLMTSGLSLAYPEKLLNYCIKFNNIPEGIIRFTENTTTAQILQIITEAPLLSSIKVNQHLRDINRYQRKDLIIFVSIAKLWRENIRKLVIESFSAKQTHNLLVIDGETTKKTKRNIVNSLCQNLLDILVNNESKKVIIIGDHKNNLASELIGANSVDFIKLKDKNKFENFTPKTQERVLKQCIYLQGHKMSLNRILNVQSAKLFLDQPALLNIIKGVTLRIDDPSVFELMSIEDNYIKRKFSRQVVKSHILSSRSFLDANLLLISKATRQDLVDQKAVKKFISSWKEHPCVTDMRNGIILLPDLEPEKIFQTIVHPNSQHNIYWLEYVNKKLLLERVSGRIQPIKNYIEDFTQSDIIMEDDFLKPCNMGMKRFILSGEPGSGKSSFLSNLHKLLEEKNQYLWIKRINLNEYVSSSAPHRLLLEDIDFLDNERDKAISFLSRMLFGAAESTIENQLFIQALQNNDKHLLYPGVILFFDGFDEISPNYKPETLKLLKSIRNSNFLQLWVTTRPHEQSTLMSALNDPLLLLTSFTREQKLEYIEKYVQINKIGASAPEAPVYDNLCSQLKDIRLSAGEDIFASSESFNSRMNRFAENLDHTQRVLQDALELQFTNIPLQLRMLTEVSFRHESGNLQNFKMPELYHKFVEIKFDIYYGQKSSNKGCVLANKETRNRDRKILTTIHEQIACNILFPDEYPQRVPQENVSLIRVGLLNFGQSGLNFIHRSFAEYFASSYLIETLDLTVVQELFFAQIMLNDVYKLIRSFINGNEGFISKFQVCRNKISDLTTDSNHLSRYYDVLVTEELANILKESLLLMLELNPDSLKALSDRVMQKLHMLLVVILHSKHLFLRIFDSVMRSTLISDFLKRTGRKLQCKVCHATQVLFNCYDGPDITDFLEEIYAAQISGSCVEKDYQLYTLWDMVKHIDQHGETILHTAAGRGRFDFIQQLLIWIQNKQKLIEARGVSTMKSNVRKCTIRSSACNNLTECTFVSNADDDLKNIGNFLILKTRSFVRKTFFHVMKYDPTFEKFLNYFLTSMDRKYVEMVLEAPDNSRKTIINYFLDTFKDGRAMKALLYTLQKPSNNRALAKKLIFNVDNFKMLIEFVDSDDNDSYLNLIKFCIMFLDLTEFKELLYLTNEDKQSLLHHTAIHFRSLQVLLDFVKAHYDISVIKSILFHRDHMGQTPLHVASKVVQSSNCCKLLLDFSKDYLGLEFLYRLLFAENVFGKSVLHLTALNSFHYYQTCIDLVEYGKLNLPSAIFQEFICKPDNQQQTFLFPTDTSKISENPLQEMFTVLSPADIIQLISKSDRDSMTIFHFILKKPFMGYLLKVLLTRLQATSELSALKQVLFQLDRNNRTALHTSQVLEDAIHFPNIKSSFGFLIGFCLKNFDFATMKELLLKKDNQQKSILHHAVTYNDQCEELFDYFLEHNCDSDTIEQLLINFDDTLQTPLHTALVAGVTSVAFLALLHVAKILVGKSKSRLLLCADISKNSVLHYSMKKFRNGYIIGDLLLFARSNLSYEDFFTFINSANCEKYTFIHRTVFAKDVSALSIIFDCLQSNEIEYLMRSALTEHFLQFLVCTLPDDEILKEFLQLLKNKLDKCFLEEMIFKRDIAQKTILHYSESTSYGTILQFCTDSIDEKHLKELFPMKDQNGQTILHHMVRAKNARSHLISLKSQCDTDTFRWMLQQEDVNRHTVLHAAVNNSNFEDVVMILFQYIEDEFGRDGLIQEFIKPATNGMNVLHLSCYNTKGNSVKPLLNFSTTILSDDLWKIFACTVDNEERHILHHAVCNILSEDTLLLINFLHENLEHTVFRQMLVSTDLTGNSILHYCVFQSKCSDMIKCCLDMLERCLNLAELENFLAKTNEHQKTALHFSDNEDSENEAFKDLLEFSTKLKILTNLLFLVDNEQRAIVHYAAMQKNALKTLLNYIELLDLETKTELMFMKDAKGYSVLYFAAKHDKSSDSLKALMDFCKTALGTELLRDLLLHQDLEGSTILHFSAYCRNSFCTLDLLDYSQKNLDLTSYETFICKEDKNQRNILHHASFSYRNINIVDRAFSQYIYKGLAKQAATALFSKQDAFGKTPLHYHVEFDTYGKLNCFVMVMINAVDYEAFLHIILTRDNFQRIPLHVYVSQQPGHALVESFQYLIDFCWSHLEPQAFYSLLTTCDERKRSVFHYSFEHFNILNSNFLKFYDKSAMKKLFRMVDNQLETPLHVAVRQTFSSMECKALMEFLLDIYTDSSELRNAILVPNIDGNTILYCPCYKSHTLKEFNLSNDNAANPVKSAVINQLECEIFQTRASLTFIQAIRDNFQPIFNDFILQKVNDRQIILDYLVENMSGGPILLLEHFQNYIDLKGCAFISLEAILLKKDSCNAQQLLKLYVLVVYKEFLKKRLSACESS